MLSEIEGDDRLWTSDAAPVMCLFQNKVMFLLNIMLMLCLFMTNVYQVTSIKRPLDSTPRVAA